MRAIIIDCLLENAIVQRKKRRQLRVDNTRAELVRGAAELLHDAASSGSSSETSSGRQLARSRFAKFQPLVRVELAQEGQEADRRAAVAVARAGK